SSLFGWGFCRFAWRGGWGGGFLRCPGRSGPRGKGGGGGPAGGGGGGAARIDEALSRRSPRRYLFRTRLVQFAPLRHGCDERVLAVSAKSGGTGHLSEPRRHVEHTDGTAQRPPSSPKPAGRGRPPARDLDSLPSPARPLY